MEGNSQKRCLLSPRRPSLHLAEVLRVCLRFPFAQALHMHILYASQVLFQRVVAKYMSLAIVDRRSFKVFRTPLGDLRTRFELQSLKQDTH